MNDSWYKVTIHGGPGHQSEHVEYIWMDRQTKKWRVHLRITVDSLCERHSNSGYSSIAKYRSVSQIPEFDHKWKVIGYQSQIKHAKKMLRILGVKAKRD